MSEPGDRQRDRDAVGGFNMIFRPGMLLGRESPSRPCMDGVEWPSSYRFALLDPTQHPTNCEKMD